MFFLRCVVLCGLLPPWCFFRRLSCVICCASFAIRGYVSFGAFWGDARCVQFVVCCVLFDVCCVLCVCCCGLLRDACCLLWCVYWLMYYVCVALRVDRCLLLAGMCFNCVCVLFVRRLLWVVCCVLFVRR